MDFPVGHRWYLDSGMHQIHWYFGDQLPSDIYSSLGLTSTDITILEKDDKDENVTYGEHTVCMAKILRMKMIEFHDIRPQC